MSSEVPGGKLGFGPRTCEREKTLPANPRGSLFPRCSSHENKWKKLLDQQQWKYTVMSQQGPRGPSLHWIIYTINASHYWAYLPTPPILPHTTLSSPAQTNGQNEQPEAFPPALILPLKHRPWRDRSARCPESPWPAQWPSAVLGGCCRSHTIGRCSGGKEKDHAGVSPLSRWDGSMAGTERC